MAAIPFKGDCVDLYLRLLDEAEQARTRRAKRLNEEVPAAAPKPALRVAQNGQALRSQQPRLAQERRQLEEV